MASDYFHGWSKDEIAGFVGVAATELPPGPYQFILDPKNKDKKIAEHLVSIQYQKYTVFNDPIHGPIRLHPLLTEIINTRAFDRLKNLKQLGGAHYVYPGATHTRFEHSIGTCYIAGEFARMLQRQQPELHITDKEVLYVEIAALCHDLGHGPYSHLFDKAVVKDLGFEWEHEERSTCVFEHCVWNEKSGEFEKYGLEKEIRPNSMTGLRFIKQLIDHKPENLTTEFQRDKRYLYEIVANKTTGIDVDKWDYFARDCHYLGIPNEFQWRRLMTVSRVVKVTDPETGQKSYRICYRDKEVNNIYGMFRTRSSLHQKAYQHKTVNAVEHKFASAIVVSGKIPVLRRSRDDKSISVHDVIENAQKDPPDLSGFLDLTDAIFDHILHYSSEPQAQATQAAPTDHDAQFLQIDKAKEMIRDISERKVSHCVFSDREDQLELTPTMIAERCLTAGLDPGDICIKPVIISYASEKPKKDNPVHRVYFYKKHTPWKAFRGDSLQSKSDLVVPRKFMEKETRVYVAHCKKRTHGDCIKRVCEAAKVESAAKRKKLTMDNNKPEN